MGIAEALETMGDAAVILGEAVSPSPENPCESLEAIRDVSVRATECTSLPTEQELTLATQLIKGHSIVEVPGKWSRCGDATPVPIVLPETRTLLDFITAPCKQKVSLMRQTRQARQASNLYLKMDPVRQSLLRANACQCGRDSAHCSLQTVREVAAMNCPSSLTHDETSGASLFCVAILHRYGLPYDNAKLENQLLPETCACCNAPLWDPSQTASRADHIFVW